MTTQPAARPLALLAVVAVFVVACGGGTPTSTPGATATAAPVTQVPATVAPVTQAPAATDSGVPTFVLPSFALPSFDLPSGDEELEDLLPDELGGATVQKFSMTGESFMGGASEDNEEIQAVLDQYDKTPSDLSVAFAGTDTVALIAYRIKGVDAAQFFDAFLTAARADGEVTTTNESYGGKSVTKVVATSGDIGTVYVYTKGDVMYIVGGEDITADLLNEAFSKLA